MIEIQKLIEYAELCGHELYIKGDKVMVTNGKKLPYQLRRLIKLLRDDIYEYLKQEEELPLF